MPHYERSTNVEASADEAFAWLSDPANLPKYLPMMAKAERTERGLRVTPKGDGGEAKPRDVRFTVDPKTRRFQWQPEGTEYHGSMSVDEASGGSRVIIELHTTPGADEARTEQALDGVIGKITEALRR